MSNAVRYFSSDDIAGMIPGDAALCGFTTEGWYFFDETWAGVYGPFESEVIAHEKLNQYCEDLNR